MGLASLSAALGASIALHSTGELTKESYAMLLGGLGTRAVTVVAVAALLVLLQRFWQPIGTGIALGALAAALATAAQLLLMGTEMTEIKVPSLTITLVALIIGTRIGAMRADRSGALAGMPSGNY